ncbi:MAG: hypothetical protein AMXMBFR13_48230 [Phycisphaerae bacterium]
MSHDRIIIVQRCCALCLGLVFPTLMAAPAVGAPAAATRPGLNSGLDIGRLLAAATPNTDPAAEKRESLEKTLEAVTGPLDKATAHLALANWLLSGPVARPATHLLIGVDEPSDRQLIIDMARAARSHIAEARQLLDDENRSGGNGERIERRRLVSAADTLEAFALLFAAVDANGDAEARHDAWSDAALELSEVRESANTVLASAANLWQTLAWEFAGRRERALAALPDALARPEHRQYDFMKRLLRCRLLGDDGQFMAAQTLAIRIRAMCAEWFDDRSEVRAREQLVTLLALRNGRLWVDKLRAGSRPSDSELLQPMLDRLAGKLTAGDAEVTPIYHLEQAIPILVQPPAIPASGTPATTEPSERPATEPESTIEEPAPSDAEDEATETADPATTSEGDDPASELDE